MSPNNGILLIGILRPKLLNNPLQRILIIKILLLFLVLNIFESTFSVSFLYFKQNVNSMFYNEYVKSFGLILFELVFFILTGFLLYFCFKKIDLSETQLAHLDFSLITLFVIVTFFGPILLV